jgi:carbon storage regulator CsrA
MEALMLVLSRKKDERILLKLNENEEVELTVVRIDANKVRLGIEASNSVAILRSELIEKSPKLEKTSKY